MVTGQYRMITSNFKNLPKIASSLSIQLGLNGFSFFVSSQQLNSDALSFYFKNRKSEKEITEALSDFILKNEILHQNFSKVSVTYTDNPFCLVPNAIFEADEKELYLKYNVKTYTTDALLHASVNDTKIVFSIPKSLQSKLEEFYEIDVYNHLSAQLLHYLVKEYKQNFSPRVFVYPFKDFFYIFLLSGSEILFCNTFPYENAADFLYYLLFAFEQLNIDTTKETLYLLAPVDNEVINTITPYIFDIKVSSNTPKNFIHLRNLQA